jgi:two-component system, NtrC family, sensor kinase
VLRTISGRIAAGFAALLILFGGVTGYTIFKMRRLGADFRFIRTAYFEVALTVAQLRASQKGMVDQLGGASPLPVHTVRSGQKYRVGILEEAIGQLPHVTDHPAELALIRDRLNQLLAEYRDSEPLIAQMFAPEGDRAAAQAALLRREGKTLQRIIDWAAEIQRRTIQLAINLEQVERDASLGAISLGVVGALLGVLITLWSVYNLRPLRRLVEGVRSITAGNYRERVSVSGTTEVADLAREFNAMAAAIKDREQELVRSERLAAVGKMAAVITHEVRNPLSSIGLNAELLEEDLRGSHASSEAIALSQKIQREVDRLTSITEEYLRFARLPRPRLEKEQVNDIVVGVVEFQRDDLETRGVTVTTQLASGLPLVAADEAQLRQALLNLFRNAADAMGSGGGALRVTTRRADGGVEVRVADNGPGIASEHLPHIFEPFFSTKEGGTGLGLALTQQIIAEHGGRIDVASGAGEGTTFVMTLPAA